MRTWIPLIISTMGILLALGYNWRRVDEIAVTSENQTQTIRSLSSIYVRQDVHSMQLDDINRQLNEIKALLQQRSGTEYGRRLFDK